MLFLFCLDFRKDEKMADDHVGFSITPKVDLSGFDKAVQLSNKFEDKLNKIDQGLSRLHAPSA